MLRTLCFVAEGRLLGSAQLKREETEEAGLLQLSPEADKGHSKKNLAGKFRFLTELRTKFIYRAAVCASCS